MSFHIIPLPRDCHADARNDNRVLRQNTSGAIQSLRQNTSEARHQADNLAKLRHEHLSLLELSQILGAVSSEISLMWLSAVRGTRIDVATQRAERATPSRQSAELWHEHLSVYGLIAKIFCAVSNAISQVWLTLLRQTRNIVTTTMTFA